MMIFPDQMLCGRCKEQLASPRNLLPGLGCFFASPADLLSPRSPAGGRRCCAWEGLQRVRDVNQLECIRLKLQGSFFFHPFPDHARYNWNQAMVVLFSNPPLIPSTAHVSKKNVYFVEQCTWMCECLHEYTQLLASILAVILRFFLRLRCGWLPLEICLSEACSVWPCVYARWWWYVGYTWVVTTIGCVNGQKVR